MGEEMRNLKNNTEKVPGWVEPIIIDLNNLKGKEKLRELYSEGKINFISDSVDFAIEELYHIEKPSQIDDIDQENYEAFKSKFGNGDTDMYGKWVYFPWNATLVHFPNKDDLRKLRGSRNRDLINDQERKKLIEDKTILIAGLSVGSNVVNSLLIQGIGNKYVLVDMDNLDPTNLNRIRSSYDQVGIHKVDIVAKTVSELDPFLEQIHYKQGLNEENLKEIIRKHKPNLIIDEMDSLKMKIVIREEAKKAKIPVLMATDDGDDILLDIERFDLDNSQPVLHGVMPDDVVEHILAAKNMSRIESGKIIGKYFVDLDNVPVRMIESLLRVGKTLPSWPQLGSAATLSGLYVSYAARKIILGQSINSGRFLMGPEKQLNPEINTKEYKERKKELIDSLT